MVEANTATQILLEFQKRLMTLEHQNEMLEDILQRLDVIEAKLSRRRLDWRPMLHNIIGSLWLKVAALVGLLAAQVELKTAILAILK